MGFDYYAILNIPRNSSPLEILRAYRKYAIATHPKNQSHRIHPQNPPNGIPELTHLPGVSKSKLWEYVNEAFDVLSKKVFINDFVLKPRQGRRYCPHTDNPQTKEIYDLHGEEGLKSGISNTNGYAYHGNHMQTYKDALHSPLPCVDEISAYPPLHSIHDDFGVRQKDPNLEIELPLDITETYHGTVKSIKIFRHKYYQSRYQSILQEQNLHLNIPPGILPGSKFVFREQGDQGPAIIPADVVFKVQEIENGLYRRCGSALLMNYAINLCEALFGFSLTIQTIDDRQFNIMVTDVVEPKYVKRILNEGLPLEHDSKLKGDLYIHFDIKFPKYIPTAIKDDFRNVFDKLRK